MIAGLLVVLLVSCQTTDSVEDPASTHFIKFYGRDGDQTGVDLVALPDGSLVLFGTSRATDSTSTQWYVVKVDAKGTIITEKVFGAPGRIDEARDIELMKNGNLVLVGNTSKGSHRDAMIMTLTPDLVKIDSNTVFVDFVGTAGDEDVSSVTEISDGFIIAGSTTYIGSKTPVAGQADTRDAMQLRVYSNLTKYPISWQQSYGYYSDDYSVKVVEGTVAGWADYYVFGATNNPPSGHPTVNYNFWLFGIGSQGVPFSQVTPSGSISADERMSSFCYTPSGFVMTGLVQSGSSPSDLYFVESLYPDPVNGFDALAREKNLSITLGSSLSGRTAVARSAITRGFLILAEENGFNGNQNWILTRVNENGTLAWSQPIVFGGEGIDSCGSLQELPDGRIVIIGTMRTGRPDAGEYKMTLVKVNPEGKFEK
ncbi:MAG: hypothetical protein JNN04_08405 [Cyclobacteriaceae bacterium]|nr:hypothetical protein [Cyclobacteriaceae bacterium]